MIKQKIPNQHKIWNNIAPEWEKHKQIPSELSKKFLKQCSGKIIDFGSGTGRHMTKIKKGKTYFLDFSEEMLKLTKEKAKKKKIPAEFIISDMKKTSIKDNFFDYGISISSLHCLNPQDAKKAIKELYRILKPEAKVLVGVWNFHSKRFNQKKGKEKLIGWTDKGKRYYYLFEEDEIHNMFKKTGFKILSNHNTEMMINFIVQK
jgi:ubiquinone/menaquinone biosynthesis C-methylase UbiE